MNTPKRPRGRPPKSLSGSPFSTTLRLRIHQTLLDSLKTKASKLHQDLPSFLRTALERIARTG